MKQPLKKLTKVKSSSSSTLPAKVLESTTYDNFVGKKETVQSTLTDALDLEVADAEEKREWKKHWKGMPAFRNEKDNPYQSVLVHFRTQEDVDRFAKLLDLMLTKKTKTIWYPIRPVDEMSLLRWVEDES